MSVMSNSSVCADASLLIKLSLPEDGSDRANQLWLGWNRDRVSVVAPNLVLYEFVSAVWQCLRRNVMSVEQADRALEELLALPLVLANSLELHSSAFRMAGNFNLPSSYDAHYLALAAEMECEFWTADERLYNSVRDRFPLIRWVGAA